MMKHATKQSKAENCTLAHDLANDLSVILGRCELLSNIVSRNTDAAKHVRVIQVLASHMVDRIAERPDIDTDTVSGTGACDHVNTHD